MGEHEMSIEGLLIGAIVLGLLLMAGGLVWQRLFERRRPDEIGR
jgi:hypothetical protein